LRFRLPRLRQPGRNDRAFLSEPRSGERLRGEAVDASARAPIRRLGALVDLQVEIGLTTFAPKYTVILSGTYRFGVPGL
jgi:hypothetical protein